MATVPPHPFPRRVHFAVDEGEDDELSEISSLKPPIIYNPLDASPPHLEGFVLKDATFFPVQASKKIRSGFLTLGTSWFNSLVHNKTWVVLTEQLLSFHNEPFTPSHRVIFIKDLLGLDRCSRRSRTLYLRSQGHKDISLTFENETDLHNWWEDIYMAGDFSRVGNPTNFKHIVRVQHNLHTGRLEGLPPTWAHLTKFLGVHPLSPNPNTEYDVLDISPQNKTSHLSVASIAPSPLPSAIVTQPARSNENRSPISLTRGSFKPSKQTAFSSATSNKFNPSVHRFRDSPFRYQDKEPCDLTDKLTNLSNVLVSSSDFFEHRGAEVGDRKVIVRSVKAGHLIGDELTRVQQRFRREIKMLHQLQCKHCLKIYGTSTHVNGFRSLISPALLKGDIMAYLRDLGFSANIPLRLKLLCEIASGLNYLHSYPAAIIHGNLRGANILINDDGQAVLSEFGISSLVSVNQNGYIQANFRWMDSCLFQTDQFIADHLNVHTDVYAFGSVLLEVLTGLAPYSHIENEMECIKAIQHGVKPRRPTLADVPSIVWNLMGRCWNRDNFSRPSMALALCRCEDALEQAEFWNRFLQAPSARISMDSSNEAISVRLQTT